MKKTTSLVLLLIPILIYVFMSINKYIYINENLENLISYIFLWSGFLFILSIFAIKLDLIKYKIWLIVSIIVSIISIHSVYPDGDGGSFGISFDGQYITMLLASLYSILSIIYFLVQFLKSRKIK